MERVIRKTISILLDRIDIEKEVHKLTIQKRMEFAILTTMPLLVLFFLRITSGSYMEVMYQTLAGRITMTAALLAMGAAAFIGIRMTRIRL